jgi:glucose/arabinose dehydrogenase
MFMKIDCFHFHQLSTLTLRKTSFLLLIFGLSACNKVEQKVSPPTDESAVLSHNSRQDKSAVDKKLIADGFVSPLGVVAVPNRNSWKGEGDNDHGQSADHRNEDKRKTDDRLFVIDQIGRIWIIDENGNKLPEPFLDITSKVVPLNPNYDERGLLGFAFHPDYLKNGRFFVYYNAPRRAGGPQPGVLWNNLSRIVEFRVSSSNRNKADVASERALIELDDPQSNHNGGTIAFGPDDYLYIAIGDGGGANDVGPGHVEDWYPVNPGGNGQDVEANLFGNILRIDVNRGSPYGVPRDNPFVGRPGRDEIYAYGFRNPYRFSFDIGGSHRLFAGDAGQLLYEEIDVVRKGQNYGWNVKEGRHCFNALNSLMELPSCPFIDPLGNRLIDPVIEVNNFQNPKGGRATTVIGGNVYRGDDIKSFRGEYIFGTFSQNPGVPNAELFISHPEGSGMWDYSEISLKSTPNDIGYFLKGFGQDNEGELYLALSLRLGPSGTEGKIFKLVAVDGDRRGGSYK